MRASVCRDPYKNISQQGTFPLLAVAVDTSDNSAFRALTKVAQRPTFKL